MLGTTYSADPKVILGACLPFAFLAYLIPLILLKTYVIARLWDWYIVPAFGTTPLRMVFAFGIIVLVHAVYPTKSDNKKLEPKDFYLPLFNPLFSLLVGWIGSFWI